LSSRCRGPIASRLNAMDAFLHNADPEHAQWRDLQIGLVAAQLAFVNSARRSLHRAQRPPLAWRAFGTAPTGLPGVPGRALPGSARPMPGAD
jgi:hypothetical protein